MSAYIDTLITEGLHYCCPWAFFKIFRKTAQIAARLGVSDRTVRRAKARVDDGEEKCRGCARCMKQQVHSVRLIGKKELFGEG